MQTLVSKAQRVQTSGKMMAIVGYLLGEQFTEPSIADLCVTSDGFVLAQHDGEAGCNHFIGGADDLERNLRGFASVAFDEEEAKRFLSTAWRRIRDMRRGRLG